MALRPCSTSGISSSFLELSRSSGQVTHVLLTRSRLCPRPKPGSSLHLHVLSTPPAFVLSQDQTLRESLAWYQRRRPKPPTIPLSDQEELSSRDASAHTCGRLDLTGSEFRPRPKAGSNLGDHSAAHKIACERRFRSRALLSFQRPCALRGGGTTSAIKRDGAV